MYVSQDPPPLPRVSIGLVQCVHAHFPTLLHLKTLFLVHLRRFSHKFGTQTVGGTLHKYIFHILALTAGVITTFF